MAEKMEKLTAEEAAADLGVTAAQLQVILASAYDLGFQECADWWEIHHYQSVQGTMNPWRD